MSIISRRAAAACAALLGALGTGQAVSAAVQPTTYSVSTKVAPDSYTTQRVQYGNSTYNLVRTADYSSADDALQFHVSAWQATVANGSITAVTQVWMGLWSEGIGVYGYGDNDVNSGTGKVNDHQIDNSGGVDMVMLQFNRPVRLTQIGRYAFGLGGDNGTYDSDASIWADTGYLLGTGSTYTTTAALNQNVSALGSTSWESVAGTTTRAQPSSLTTLSTSKVASTWLVSADLFRSDATLDGFKLSNVTAAVPEPATWATMIVGFGAVGGTLRRSRRTGAAVRA